VCVCVCMHICEICIGVRVRACVRACVRVVFICVTNGVFVCDSICSYLFGGIYVNCIRALSQICVLSSYVHCHQHVCCHCCFAHLHIYTDPSSTSHGECCFLPVDPYSSQNSYCSLQEFWHRTISIRSTNKNFLASTQRKYFIASYSQNE